ncbi:MAG: hypothetical protein UHD09_02385 [Bifidobacterium sp.]|nr:hypothetical protein [Bifidobacterium sp.]
MSKTINLTPTAKNGKGEAPVKINYGSVNMRLPRLDDSTALPLSVLLAGMDAATQGWDNLDSETQMRYTMLLINYLVRKYPKLADELDKSDKIIDIGRIFAAWAEASGEDEDKLDPKA